MADELRGLSENIGRWRGAAVDDYWVRVDYIGSALNRLGDHVLTQAKGGLWHRWHDDWRHIEPGSDYWLFSVPGAFAWTREMLSLVGSGEAGGASPIQLEFHDQYGFVKKLRVKMPERDAANFTFEVMEFGVGAHPDFDK